MERCPSRSIDLALAAPEHASALHWSSSASSNSDITKKSIAPRVWFRFAGSCSLARPEAKFLLSRVWSRVGNTARHSTPSSRDAGGLLVPVSGVDDAEDRDREQVGEEAIKGKRLTRMPNKDMMEPNVSETSVTHQECTRKMCVCVCAGRCDVYTHRRVHGSCYCVDAKLPKQQQQLQQLRSCTAFMSVKKIICCKNYIWNQNSQVDLDNVELLAHAELFPEDNWKPNWTLSFSPFVSKDDEVHHVGLW